jgi:dCMP deaminase
MFTKFDYGNMLKAYINASYSHAKRKKVGSILVHENRGTSEGYNGRLSFLDNACEDEEGKTLPDVIHAELNCILFAAKKGISTNGATMYITCAPCYSCAPMIAAAGIEKIIYNEDYISTSKGTDVNLIRREYKLEISKMGIPVEKLLERINL